MTTRDFSHKKFILCVMYFVSYYCSLIRYYMNFRNMQLQRDTFSWVQGDQKVSVLLMITMQKVKSNVQSVPRQSPGLGGH
jgi:hypothetical protein